MVVHRDFNSINHHPCSSGSIRLKLPKVTPTSTRSTEDTETCLKHLKKYEGAIEDLVRGVNGCHDRVDNCKVEVNSLKGRVLILETRNVLLEAKVGMVLG